MRNLRIQAQLIAASTMICLVFVGVVVYSIIATAAMRSSYSRIITQAVPTQAAAQKVNADMWQLLTFEQDALLTGNVGNYPPVMNDVNTQLTFLSSHMAAGAQRKTLNQMVNQISNVMGSVGDVITDASIGSTKQGEKLLASGNAPRAQMEQEISNFIKTAQQTDNRTAQQDQRSAMTTLVLEIVFAGAACVAGMILIAGTARRIAHPVVKMAKGAMQIADGNLEVEQMDESTKDEIGDVAKAYNRMVQDLRSMIGRVRGLSVIARLSCRLATISSCGELLARLTTPARSARKARRPSRRAASGFADWNISPPLRASRDWL